jgi:hypothetical protein
VPEAFAPDDGLRPDSVQAFAGESVIGWSLIARKAGTCSALFRRNGTL